MNTHISKLLLVFLAAISASCTKPSLADRVGACSGPGEWDMVIANGYAFIEAHALSFLIPQEDDAAFEKHLAIAKKTTTPIYSTNVLFPGDIRLTGNGVDTALIARYVEIAMRRAKQIGIKIVVLGSGGARQVPEGFPHNEARKQFIEVCRVMGNIAQRHNITITVEPLNSGENNFINTVAEGLAIVKEVDHPNVRLLADIFHMMREGESPESIVQAGDYLRHCHIAEMERRTPPGVAGDDFTPYLKALKEISYKGNIAIECGWKDWETELPVAIAELKRQIKSVGL